MKLKRRRQQKPVTLAEIGPNKLHFGDNLSILKQYPENYFDSGVMDPPGGISFMGKEWDSDKGGRDNWIAWMERRAREIYRVLKPGAFCVVWAIPRTSHWTAIAFENAGFTVDDRFSHIFGSGFPKNHNISKAIDKQLGYEPTVVGKQKQSGAKFKLTQELIDNGGFNDPERQEFEITDPTSPEAKQWDDWGSALKPSVEDYWVFQKPISEKTIAKNVLKWGTGGFNLGACRVGTSGSRTNSKSGDYSDIYQNYGAVKTQVHNRGRYPSHLLLSHSPDCSKKCVLWCPVWIIDQQSGIKKGTGETKTVKGTVPDITSNNYSRSEGRTRKEVEYTSYGDSGGASRFFNVFSPEEHPQMLYQAKPSKAEKDRGLTGEEKSCVYWQTANGTSGKPSSMSAGRNTVRKNTHPTVKSVKLMAHLIKLVTPPGGLVLDAFMGSASTGVACIQNGFTFVGIDSWEEAFDIAVQRVGFEYSESKECLR